MKKSVSHQRSTGKRRKGIVTTKREAAWRRDLRAGWKGFLRQAQSVLAAAGFIWLLIEIVKALGGG